TNCSSAMARRWLATGWQARGVSPSEPEALAPGGLRALTLPAREVALRLGQAHINLPVFPLGLKLRMYQGLARLMLSCRPVELPAMPGAGDNTAAQLPLPQRPALVRAHAIQRVNCAIHVVQRHYPVIGNAFARGAWRTFANGDEWNPVGHGTIHSPADEGK